MAGKMGMTNACAHYGLEPHEVSSLPVSGSCQYYGRHYQLWAASDLERLSDQKKARKQALEDEKRAKEQALMDLHGGADGLARFRAEEKARKDEADAIVMAAGRLAAKISDANVVRAQIAAERGHLAGLPGQSSLCDVTKPTKTAKQAMQDYNLTSSDMKKGELKAGIPNLDAALVVAACRKHGVAAFANTFTSIRLASHNAAVKYLEHRLEALEKQDGVRPDAAIQEVGILAACAIADSNAKAAHAKKDAFYLSNPPQGAPAAQSSTFKRKAKRSASAMESTQEAHTPGTAAKHNKTADQPIQATDDLQGPQEAWVLASDVVVTSPLPLFPNMSVLSPLPANRRSLQDDVAAPLDGVAAAGEAPPPQG